MPIFSISRIPAEPFFLQRTAPLSCRIRFLLLSLKTGAFLFLLGIALLSGRISLAWEAEVLHVHDGDSIFVRKLATGEKLRIRLQGIDAPEMKTDHWPPQPFCVRARNFARQLMPVKSRVGIRDQGRDQYDRVLAETVTLADGRIVQEEMLKAGMAWVYRRYCIECAGWKTLEKDARDARRGLWRDVDSGRKPVPPWLWRHRVRR